MIVKGKVFKFSDNVNTDEIIPARYLNDISDETLKKYCMEDIRPGFSSLPDVEDGIIVAGENFGCGSSREHAPVSIKKSGIKCVIAKSFARIFLRNSFNIGLSLIELDNVDVFEEGNEIEINFSEGKIKTKSKSVQMKAYPEFMQDIIKQNGWLNYLQNCIEG